MFAGKKSAQIREILISESAWEEMTCLFAPSLEDQFVNMAYITSLTGLTDKWFYKLIKDDVFPKPIKMGRSSRWLKSEVEAWLQERINQSRK